MEIGTNKSMLMRKRIVPQKVLLVIVSVKTAPLVGFGVEFKNKYKS